jgi:ribonuclease HI
MTKPKIRFKLAPLSKQTRAALQIIVIHIHGYKDRSGVGHCAWSEVRAFGRNRRRLVRTIERIEGISLVDVQFAALRSALEHAAPGSKIDIYTDSRILIKQYQHRIGDDGKFIFYFDLVTRRDLKVNLLWIPPKHNIARKLLEGMAHNGVQDEV